MVDDIGFHLAQPFYWHNPSSLLGPIEWVNKRKLRAKNSVNTIWWLCKNPIKCKANVSNVLVPYSQKMEKLIARPEGFFQKEGIRRPSGHVMGKASWEKNNGGAIPPNMLQIANSESNSQYLRYCKACGVKPHPARFPEALPTFFIRLLTEEGDLVVDIFAGSNTTGHAAESLKRRWKSFELSQEYVGSSSFRFVSSPEEAAEVWRQIEEGEFVRLSGSPEEKGSSKDAA